MCFNIPPIDNRCRHPNTQILKRTHVQWNICYMNVTLLTKPIYDFLNWHSPVVKRITSKRSEKRQTESIQHSFNTVNDNINRWFYNTLIKTLTLRSSSLYHWRSWHILTFVYVRVVWFYHHQNSNDIKYWKFWWRKKQDKEKIGTLHWCFDPSELQLKKLQTKIKTFKKFIVNWVQTATFENYGWFPVNSIIYAELLVSLSNLDIIQLLWHKELFFHRYLIFGVYKIKSNQIEHAQRIHNKAEFQQLNSNRTKKKIYYR